MRESVDISIVVPVYNAERTIGRCLDSLLAQSGNDTSIEVVAIDDGSTDGTPAILSSYAANYSDMRVITVSNGGPSEARNIGLLEARGRWVGFCDSDDWVDPGCYAYASAMAEQKGASIAVFGYKNVRPHSRRVHMRRIMREIDLQELGERCLLDPCVQGFVWNKLYLRSVLARESFPKDMHVCEDLLFNINICKSGEDITALLLPGAYYNYDLSGESLTRGKDVYLPVRRTLAEISQDEKFRQAARGALYANAIKTLTGLASQDIQIEELGFAHEFYGCHACPVSEKMLVALRRVLLLIRGTLHLQTKHVKFRTRND